MTELTLASHIIVLLMTSQTARLKMQRSQLFSVDFFCLNKLDKKSTGDIGGRERGGGGGGGGCKSFFLSIPMNRARGTSSIKVSISTDCTV